MWYAILLGMIQRREACMSDVMAVETTQKPKQELNLMIHMSKIMELTNKTGVDDALYETAREHIDFIANELDVTPVQAVLFCHVFDTSLLSFRTSQDTLFGSLKCSKLKYLEYLNELDGLINKNYVTQILDTSRTPCYKIPREFILSIRKGKPLKPENFNNIPIERFFSVLNRIFTRRYNDELLSGELLDILDSLLQGNNHLELIKKIDNYHLDGMDRGLLLYFCDKKINCREDVDFEHIKKQFFDSGEDDGYHQLIIALQNDRHILQNLELIEHVHFDGLAMNESFKLTQSAEDELFVELTAKNAAKLDKFKKDFIAAENITAKAMFYNAAEEDKIEKLTNLLQQENFCTITQRLSEKGLRKGFACLFSGLPGTGKTETVYQIAKKTGRDIMAVDISQIKSMWVGESEKHIKEIFTKYKKCVEKNDCMPILLLNEADGVIGKRIEFNENSRSVDQMENTMQNIILQEIENLEGILIATTNLTKNMDKAFERRFLYKIEFTKPESTTRKSLWKNMLPELSDEDALLLATRFDFSGGQIENIVRKRTVDMVLTGKDPDIETLLSYCQDESLVKEKSTNIGFRSAHEQKEC
jgi:hypothetical protein